LRAWRALGNLRSSWLSREAVLSALFVGLGGASLLLPVTALGWTALAAGLGVVVSIDAVYRVIPRAESWAWHSSDAALTTLLLLGIGAGAPLVVWTTAALKVLLFAIRWGRGAMGLPVPLAGLRLFLLAGAVAGPLEWWATFALAVAGEAIDRSAFYAELEPSTPTAEMARAAAEGLRSGTNPGLL